MKMALEKHFLPPFPGLTTKSLKAHPPRSEATAKGHLDAKRKNTNSTKPKTKKEEPKSPDNEFFFPPALEKGHRTHLCFVTLIETKSLLSCDPT